MCPVMSDSDDAAPGQQDAGPSVPPGAGATAPPDAGASVPPGDDWRLAAWRSFLRTHTHLLRRLEQGLQGHGKITLGTYDVLVQLAEAPENRLRMSELAEAVLLSRSGLTRLVDRLQKDGLVQRQRDPGDARGMYTVLTANGRQALRDASGVHLAQVSELVLDRLSEAELRELQQLMLKLDPAAAPQLSAQSPEG